MRAVSLAGFSNYVGLNSLACDARKAYSAALVSLNKALRSLDKVKLDQTLAAVLILMVFEVSLPSIRTLKTLAC